ncbi:MAG TPA: hypothetical protein VNJ12_06010 [Candidatus Dormibacteraeota bacterium]|nr:hypothetical protein [Candidatus Dormibacteraeota bacterium]
MKAARIPAWAWVLFFVLAVLLVAELLKRESGGAPPLGFGPVPR